MNPEIARSIVYDAWKDRQAVVLCTDGWHTCGRSCKMQKLRAYACIDGKHAIPTSTCHIHPHAKPVLVDDLFVCTATGNKDILKKEYFLAMKDKAIVCNIGHFDVEIQVEQLQGFSGIEHTEIKPQVDKFTFPNGHSIIPVSYTHLTLPTKA